MVKHVILKRYGSLPYSLDGVLALAFDGGFRVKGLFKFPLWPTFVSLSGVKLGDDIYLQGNQPTINYAHFVMDSDLVNYGGGRNGMVRLMRERAAPIRIRITSSLMQFSLASGQFDWGSDLHGQSDVSTEISRSALHELPDLAATYKSQSSSAAWAAGIDDPSFAVEADKVYVGKGLSVGAPIFLMDPCLDGNNDRNRDARRTEEAFLRAVMDAGAKTRPMPLPR